MGQLMGKDAKFQEFLNIFFKMVVESFFTYLSVL